MSALSVYRALSPAARRLCHVSWAYKAIERYIGTFVGASIYLATGSVWWVFVYAAALIASICLGYSGGYLLLAGRSVWSRFVFTACFAFSLAAFVAILFVGDELSRSLLFGVCWGLCHGLYYLGYHWNMLRHTVDDERDDYMTVYSSGTLALDAFVPFVATATFMASATLGLPDSFVLAGVVLWILSLAGIAFCLRNFSDSDSLPKPKLSNFAAMFRHPNFPRTAMFFLVLRMDANISTALLPVLAVLVLHDAVNLGMVSTAVALFSIAFMVLSHRSRTVRSRARFARIWFVLEMFAFVAAIVSVLTPWFSASAYLLAVLALPFAKSVSWAVTQLYELRAAALVSADASDIGMESVVFRDTLIALGRLFFLCALVAIYSWSGDLRVLLVSGFALWIGALLLQSALVRSLDPEISPEPA